jgi:hypothetical protein
LALPGIESIGQYAQFPGHFGSGFAAAQPKINGVFFKRFVVMLVFHLTVDVAPPFPCPSNRSNPKLLKGFFIVVVCFLIPSTKVSAADDKSKSLVSTVMKLIGDARYSMDSGKNWQPVQLGLRLNSGSILQTAQFGRVYLQLGEDIDPLPRTSSVNGALFDPEQYPENLLGLLDDSAIELTEIKSLIGEKPNADVQRLDLKLRSGGVIVNVKRMATNSSFEIKCSTNAVIRMQGAVALVKATGDFSIFKGEGNVVVAKNQLTNRVPALNQFIIATGSVTNMNLLSDHWRHDIWLQSDLIYENWATPPKNK